MEEAEENLESSGESGNDLSDLDPDFDPSSELRHGDDIGLPREERGAMFQVKMTQRKRR